MTKKLIDIIPLEINGEKWVRIEREKDDGNIKTELMTEEDHENQIIDNL